MHFRFLTTLPLVVLLAVGIAACGGSESTPSSTDGTSSGDAATEQTASGTTSETSRDVDQTVTLQPKGNQMKYKQTEFTVAPGETVRLVFENTATSPSMQHNVVILTSNEDGLLQKVGEAGTRAGSTNDYVPQKGDLQEQILAYTPMSKPGETVSVTFTAPEETGDYGYLCTFPGHWATMQGTMHVRS